MNKKANFCILYLEIGRGHPFYLNDVAEAPANNKDRKPKYIIVSHPTRGNG
jgi:hypothetical protein